MRTFARFALVGLIVLTLQTAGLTQAGGTPPGTVAWDKGYPKTVAALPGRSGEVIVLGSYTTNPGWTPTSAAFAFIPASGGVPKGGPLDMLSGKIGMLNAQGQIVEKSFPLPKGSYQGWLAVSYEDANKNSVPVLSTIIPFTIN